MTVSQRSPPDSLTRSGSLFLNVFFVILSLNVYRSSLPLVMSSRPLIVRLSSGKQELF